MADDATYRPKDVAHYPLHMVVGIVPPANVGALTDALLAAQVQRDQIDVAQGDSDAQRIVDETEGGGAFGRVARLLSLGEEQGQRERYVEALRGGDSVVRVLLNDQEQRQAIAAVFVQHGGRYVNYYGRWTVEELHR